MKPVQTNTVLRGLSSLCAFAGGTFMVFSGFTSHGFFLVVLSYLDGVMPSIPILQAVIGMVVMALNFMITLGGAVVVVGGALIVLGRVAAGTALILIGGGTGSFSLVLAFVYYLVTTGLSSVIVHAEYWLGVVLASTARRFGRRAIE